MSLHLDIRKKLAAFTLEVSLQGASETIGFLGESGCGKSMTMRCIAGIETPDEGIIQVNGITYFDSAAHINLSPQQRKTALLFQSYMLFPHMTVAENIASGIDRHASAADRAAAVKRELVRFSLVGLESRYPLQLSGGQQQRVALARMLAAHPGILMLDEPFSALDAHLKDLLAQNLVNLFDAFDGTILYVSHDIDEALRFCDRIAVVDQGYIQELAPAREIVSATQSEAGLKLTGCKNVTEVVRKDAHTVHALKWGITVQISSEVSSDVQKMGIRAFRLQRADGPGYNNYRMRVEETSDSRYDRSLTLTFLDRKDADAPLVMAGEDEMRYLHQRMVWRISTLDTPLASLPQKGDELWIHIPEEHALLVNR